MSNTSVQNHLSTKVQHLRAGILGIYALPGGPVPTIYLRSSRCGYHGVVEILDINRQHPLANIPNRRIKLLTPQLTAPTLSATYSGDECDAAYQLWIYLQSVPQQEDEAITRTHTLASERWSTEIHWKHAERDVSDVCRLSAGTHAIVPITANDGSPGEILIKVETYDGDRVIYVVDTTPNAQVMPNSKWFLPVAALKVETVSGKQCALLDWQRTLHRLVGHTHKQPVVITQPQSASIRTFDLPAQYRENGEYRLSQGVVVAIVQPKCFGRSVHVTDPGTVRSLSVGMKIPVRNLQSDPTPQTPNAGAARWLRDEFGLTSTALAA